VVSEPFKKTPAENPSHFCSIALPCYPRENAKRSLKSHQSQARIINRSIVSVLVGQQDTMSTEVFGSECGLDLMRTMKMSLATCVISKLNTSSSSGKNSSSYCACLELVDRGQFYKNVPVDPTASTPGLASSIWTSPMTPSSSRRLLQTAVHLGTKMMV
jgi:hypothetical protein